MVHHAPTCAAKIPLGEWENVKAKNPIEGEGPVEEVLPTGASKIGGGSAGGSSVTGMAGGTKGKEDTN